MNISKPEMKINQLALLKTIKTHTFRYQEGPTAKELTKKKRQFSTLLLNIDTLRMWLLRKNRKNILHRVKNSRSFRYTLTRQGLKRIRYLRHKAEELEVQNETNNRINLFLLAKAIEKKEQEEKKDLIDLVKTIVALRNQ